MAWETALDRLLLQQIHLAEKGEVRADEVKRQVCDLLELNPQRPETAFHLGYSRVMLGVEMPEPNDDDASQRWYTFGRLRGHDRRGERNWVVDLLNDPQQIMELLSEPRIAAQCLPVALRTLFWSGDLELAVRAIAYLASVEDNPESAVLVDAALSDLLAKLEKRGEDGKQTTLSILQQCVGLASFERLPTDVRVRYRRALADKLLRVSDFSAALAECETALGIDGVEHRVRTSIGALAALAELRLHRFDELSPDPERSARDAALERLTEIARDEKHSAPDSLFVLGILEYEASNYPDAAKHFDLALQGYRRAGETSSHKLDRTGFFLAASLLAGEIRDETSRALRLMTEALDSVKPDLESFYPVHESLKRQDRKLALRFLDAVEVGRGTAPEQLLFVALEYLALGEAEPARAAAERVLQVTIDLDQRIEALRVCLTAQNMMGKREEARATFLGIRDLLMQRGALTELENLLKNEEFVGQALDQLEVKCELVALYEEMEDREFEKASLQTGVARSLKARKDVDSLRQAHGILQEVEIHFPELAREDLRAIEKLLEISDAEPTEVDGGKSFCDQAAERLGHRPRILVVGGNERQRRHRPRFDELASSWGFYGEWLMANYTSPQKLVNTIAERLKTGVDLLLLLHWNRHETTEPALDMARRLGIPARTVHYAGFTSLQVCLTDMLQHLGSSNAAKV